MRHFSAAWTLYLLAFAAAPAEAGFVMIVDDPSTQEIDTRIEDGGTGDNNPITGLISYSGIVGGIQLSATGQSKGAVGSVAQPQLILNLAESTRLATGYSGGTVDVFLTDTDFDADFAKGVADIDVNGLGGFFEFSFFGDSNDREFGEGFEIASTEGSVSPDFDQTLEGSADPVGSLTIQSRVGFTNVTHIAGFSTELTLEGSPPSNPWHNSDNPLDVDASSSVEPLDALLGINSMNSEGPRRLPIPPEPGKGPPPFYDVSDDEFLSPIDALLVINHLNAAARSAPATSGVQAIAIPEPGGMYLLLLGTVLLALRIPTQKVVLGAKPTRT